MRDVNQSKVYRAEEFVERLLASTRLSGVRTVQAFGSTLTIPDEVLFADVPNMQRYVDRLLALDWVRATFPRATMPVTVKRARGAKTAKYVRADSVITIPDSTMAREIVLLHEVAHHLHEMGDQPAHGPTFVGIEMLLVREVMGPEVGLLLTAAMDQAGVPMSFVNRVDRTAC